MKKLLMGTVVSLALLAIPVAAWAAGCCGGPCCPTGPCC